MTIQVMHCIPKFEISLSMPNDLTSWVKTHALHVIFHFLAKSKKLTL